MGGNPLPIGSMYGIFIYLHLVDLYGKCKYIPYMDAMDYEKGYFGDMRIKPPLANARKVPKIFHFNGDEYI